MDLKDKIALVTGASRGLGYATALALGSAGAKVIALARTVGGLEELDDAIRASGGANPTLVPLDICDDPGLERLGAALHAQYGRLDLWIHTAVHAPPLAPVEHADAKDLDSAIATNLRATQRLIRVLDPLLRIPDHALAVFPRDPEFDADTLRGAFGAAKAGQERLVRSWGGNASKVSGLRVLMVDVPPMRTATRARFYPGEDTTVLAKPTLVAKRMISAISKDVLTADVLLRS